MLEDDWISNNSNYIFERSLGGDIMLNEENKLQV